MIEIEKGGITLPSFKNPGKSTAIRRRKLKKIARFERIRRVRMLSQELSGHFLNEGGIAGAEGIVWPEDIATLVAFLKSDKTTF
jgi:hypothetical protein